MTDLYYDTHIILTSSHLHFTTAVDCGQLPAPENGLIDGNLTTFNNTASYSCDTGYELVGDQTRTCLASGNWSGSQPSCDGENCCHLSKVSSKLYER